MLTKLSQVCLILKYPILQIEVVIVSYSINPSESPHGYAKLVPPVVMRQVINVVQT